VDDRRQRDPRAGSTHVRSASEGGSSGVRSYSVELYVEKYDYIIDQLSVMIFNANLRV